jgi:hypothetical protein
VPPEKPPLHIEEVTLTEFELLLSHSGFEHVGTTIARVGAKLAPDFLVDNEFTVAVAVRSENVIRLWGKPKVSAASSRETAHVVEDAAPENEEAPRVDGERETRIMPAFKPPASATSDEPPASVPVTPSSEITGETHPRDPEPTRRSNPIPRPPMLDLSEPEPGQPLSTAEVDGAIGSMTTIGAGACSETPASVDLFAHDAERATEALDRAICSTSDLCGSLIEIALGEQAAHQEPDSEVPPEIEVRSGEPPAFDGNDDDEMPLLPIDSKMPDLGIEAEVVDDSPESRTNLPIPLSRPPSRPPPPDTHERQSSRPPPLPVRVEPMDADDTPPSSNGIRVEDDELIIDERLLIRRP